MSERRELALQVIDEVEKAVVGKRKILEKIMTAILAGGHILIEDIPGTGKTTMALAFSRAMRLKETRVQFTPDVLPADLTGFSIYQKETGQFVYQPGAVMCNILLADEINRTSPKTQSALLEVMEEKQVTVDGVTRRTGDPFIVICNGKSRWICRYAAFAGISVGPVSDLREDGISRVWKRRSEIHQKSAEWRGCGKCFSDFGTDGTVTVTEGSERSLCA